VVYPGNEIRMNSVRFGAERSDQKRSCNQGLRRKSGNFGNDVARDLCFGREVSRRRGREESVTKGERNREREREMVKIKQVRRNERGKLILCVIAKSANAKGRSRRTK
jgi:hypothetical protein